MPKMTRPDKTPYAEQRKKTKRQTMAWRKRRKAALGSSVPVAKHPWRKGWVGP